MDMGLWLAFIAATGALLLLPGPDWAFMLATGARQPRIVPPVAGLTIGYVILSLVVATGLGPLIAAVPAAPITVTLAGAGYLAFLGIRILRAPRPAAPDASTGALEIVPSAPVTAAAPGRKVLRQGVAVSTLNAKSLVLFVAFLPQFVSTTAAWPLWVQLGALGLTWTGLGAIFYVGLTAASQRLLAGRDGPADIVTRITGAAMILMGLWLAGEQFAHLLSGVH